MTSTSAGAKALVITPTFNERENIERVVERLFAAAPHNVDLLVVDDGSPDGTPDVVKRLAATNDRIHLVQRAGKQGLGTAYLTGFTWAIEHGYGAVVEMDADLSHNPADVPRLLDALKHADLAIGSRYVRGGEITNWHLARRLLSRAANIYARVALGFAVRDSTSGFRAFTTDWLRDQDLADVRSEGYVFQIEMTRRVHETGGRIAEVPITFVERAAGHSKISRGIVFEALLRVAAWAFARRFRRRRSTARARASK